MNEESQSTASEYAVRLEKKQKLQELGINPYAPPHPQRFQAAQIIQDYEKLSRDETEIDFSARIISKRKHGKSTFMHLQDETGKIQCYFKKDLVGEAYDRLKYIDIGDFIYIKGSVFKTRTEEITIIVREMELLTKALRGLPEKYHGIQDVEIKYRQRYLDLIMDRNAFERFRVRSRTIQLLRNTLDSKDFIEVETPILQPLYGGAAARPFITHHNTLNRDFYLRIAPELYLKRLIVGGFEKIYEINKNFRNEGIDIRHNPEFTMLELYWAYTNYFDIMDLVENVLSSVTQNIKGSKHFQYQNNSIDMTSPWQRIPLFEAIYKATGLQLEEETDIPTLQKAAQKMGCKVEKYMGRGKIIDQILKEKVIPDLQNPTFLYDYPIELSPLARQKDDNKRLVERFQVFIGGLEVGNAFSELNDPREQAHRFELQLEDKKRGDEEAHAFDEDYIRCLEYGMPPTGGLGIGIDRFIMLLTDSVSIRDVILFPQMKPES